MLCGPQGTHQDGRKKEEQGAKWRGGGPAEGGGRGAEFKCSTCVELSNSVSTAYMNTHCCTSYEEIAFVGPYQMS